MVCRYSFISSFNYLVIHSGLKVVYLVNMKLYNYLQCSTDEVKLPSTVFVVFIMWVILTRSAQYVIVRDW